MLSKRERACLMAARKHIENDENAYICMALRRMGDQTTRLRWYIADQLGDASTLEDWQIDRGIYRNDRQAKQDRLDWIDWMLGEK